MRKIINNEKQVILSEELLAKAQERARSLGMNLAEYVQALVDKDVRTKEYDPWDTPVPKEVDERWEKDLAESEEQDKLNPKPGARTSDELIKLLDEETTRFPDDEGN